ncbi:GNAT family N-acetyltransferase [Nocardioides ganghwensis]|uniref:N-acetyltransferase n=1 Tax=Nocardioides ganghwensis TaxID=252230 RepID=A0A4Q2S9R8_9ACTN|nr:GNAT family N-acetyltransferase [Nocardioides ganghwensis]MBD3947345.1 N-acetyltransferase [Nocardioides ganghwensis]RYC00287.1 N-acetyltransferase [Nocardioides ganghwensis]
MDTEFIDAPDHHRYELRSGDELVGFIDYRVHGDLIRLLHTEVLPAFNGQGHAGTLARSALDDARTRGLSVDPVCPYVAAYIDKHPEYADLRA